MVQILGRVLLPVTIPWPSYAGPVLLSSEDPPVDPAIHSITGTGNFCIDRVGEVYIRGDSIHEIDHVYNG
jgi:hypothetical protein